MEFDENTEWTHTTPANVGVAYADIVDPTDIHAVVYFSTVNPTYDESEIYDKESALYTCGDKECSGTENKTTCSVDCAENDTEVFTCEDSKCKKCFASGDACFECKDDPDVIPVKPYCLDSISHRCVKSKDGCPGESSCVPNAQGKSECLQCYPACKECTAKEKDECTECKTGYFL